MSPKVALNQTTLPATVGLCVQWRLAHCRFEALVFALHQALKKPILPIAAMKCFWFYSLMWKYALKIAASNKTTGLTLAFLAVTAFSLTLPMTRYAVAELNPVSVAVWRGLIASFVALVLLTLFRPERPRGRQWWRLVVCAFGTVVAMTVWLTTRLRIHLR